MRSLISEKKLYIFLACMRIKNEVFVIQFIIYSVLCIRQNRVHLSLDIRASTREMSSTLTCAILG
jgi:hypothetical protein